MGSSRHAQLMQDADNKSAQGDFERAINLYEAALDDSESTRNAEVHYKLAVLYDDKLNDPVNALHHFKRYLALSPNGTHANEVKNSIKHDEVAALTALSGDSVIARSEVARLPSNCWARARSLGSRYFLSCSMRAGSNWPARIVLCSSASSKAETRPGRARSDSKTSRRTSGL